MDTTASTCTLLSALDCDVLRCVSALLPHHNDNFALWYTAATDRAQQERMRADCALRMQLYPRGYTDATVMDPLHAYAAHLSAIARVSAQCAVACTTTRTCAETYIINTFTGDRVQVRPNRRITAAITADMITARAAGLQTCPRVRYAIEWDVPELLSASEIYLLSGVITGAITNSPNLRMFETLLRGDVPSRLRPQSYECPHTREGAIAAVCAHMRTRDGYTPLMIVASTGDASRILVAISDIDARDMRGRTALHHVCLQYWSNLDVNMNDELVDNTNRFLAQHPDTHIRDECGNSAFAYLIINGEKRALEAAGDAHCDTILDEFMLRGHDFSEIAHVGGMSASLAMFAAASPTPQCLWDHSTHQLRHGVDPFERDVDGRRFIDYIRHSPKRTDDWSESWNARVCINAYCENAFGIEPYAMDTFGTVTLAFALSRRVPITDTLGGMDATTGATRRPPNTIAHAAIANASKHSRIARDVLGSVVNLHAFGWFLENHR